MIKKTVGILVLLLLVPFSANASSLPGGEINQKFGLGTGPSLAVDFKLNSRTSFGASFGTPFYRGWFLSGNYDLRLLYKFLDQNKLAFSGLIGVAGAPYFNANSGYPFGIEAGIALSYDFTPQVTGRLNLVGSVPVLYNYGKSNPLDFWAPSSGAEIAYKFTPNIEGTLGFNGQGDLLGLNLYF